MITLKPYKELLAMAKEKIDESLAPLRANRAKKQAELKMIEIEEKMAKLEAKIFESCACKEIDFDHVIDMQNEHALLERRKKQFKTIINQLFPGS